jgi:4-amino-4-deoxy-L-arabinose transferase-like glycosyltransferase
MMAYADGKSCRPLMSLAIAIAAIMFAFPLFVPFPLLDPDEGLHASIAQEMVERGDWITPSFLGQPFFDKPILYTWCQAASLAAFGPREWAVRLPGLMFGLLGAVTTGLLAWRMFGRATGWIAGVFYATTILPTAMAQAASHDVALVPCVNLAILLLWESDRAIAAFTVGAGLFVGLSILTKGLLGVAVVGLAYGGSLLLTRRVTPMVLLQGIAVLLIAGLVAAPWYLALESHQPGFLRYYFLERHLLGFSTATQPHSHQHWWYYLPILLGGGLPWIGYLRWAGIEGLGISDWRLAVDGNQLKTDSTSQSLIPNRSSPIPLLWIWLIGWTVFLTVARSKLATYVWPAFPPLAILAAVAWTRLINGTLGETARRAFARVFVGSSWSGPIVLPVAVCVLHWTYGVHFAWPVWLAVGFAAVMSPLPLIPWRDGRCQASLAAAALSMALQFVVVMAFVVPPVAEVFSARELAEHFNREGQLPARLFIVEERIGSFVFYLDPRLRAGMKDEQLASLLADESVEWRPGDAVALPMRKISKAVESLDLGHVPYESVGRYRLYRITTEGDKR